MLKDNEHFILVNSEFPHVGHRIGLTWGHKECAELLHILLLNNRDEKRQGFPKHVASALFKLMMLHDELFPPKNLKTDIWVDAYKR